MINLNRAGAEQGDDRHASKAGTQTYLRIRCGRSLVASR
jgi:hypothetical protein